MLSCAPRLRLQSEELKRSSPSEQRWACSESEAGTISLRLNNEKKKIWSEAKREKVEVALNY